MEQREQIRKHHRARRRLFRLAAVLLAGLACAICLVSRLAAAPAETPTADPQPGWRFTLIPTPAPYMERGSGCATAIDISAFCDPDVKNSQDLVVFAQEAWENQWGYVWGTFGEVLTEELLAYKLEQYPQDVGEYEALIQAQWLGRRTADCVGLIKAYGWLDPATAEIYYGNGMPDYSTETLFEAAAEKGELATMPELPGLLVYREGHVGIYIGNDFVIEAKGTENGVVKTKLSEGEFTHWLKCPDMAYYDE